MIGISKDMDVALSKGAFALERLNESGQVYYIRTPETILLYSHESITIDTGICVTLPYGHKGVLRSIYELDKNVVIDELRIDGTGNESISVTIHSGDTAQYFRKGDIIAKLEIQPSIHSYIPENNKDITKVNRIEIKRAQSGRQYLVLYVESKDADFDETVILGDDGYPEKISRDIVESLEQVKRIDTDIFLETEF